MECLQCARRVLETATVQRTGILPVFTERDVLEVVRVGSEAGNDVTS
jgi:hypothetical protein